VGQKVIWRAVIGVLWKPFLGLAMLAASWFGGRKSGKAAAKAKQNVARLEAIKKAQETRNEVEAFDRDTLRGRATVWLRKDTKR
jgi:hypothetical protein